MLLGIFNNIKLDKWMKHLKANCNRIETPAISASKKFQNEKEITEMIASLLAALHKDQI